MNQIDLKDKVAIITGGAQGFGYSMVERFSKSGAKVVIWDKDEELLKSLTLPENVNYELVDITSYDSVQKSTIATLDKNNKAELSKNFLKVESELAKSVNKGVYKKNTAARIISRLAKKIKSIN